MSEDELKGNTVTRVANAPGNQTSEQLEEQMKVGSLVPRLAWFHLLYNWKTREILTVKSTREELALPSSRDEWERLYFCQMELPVPVYGSMATVRAAFQSVRDLDDKFDLENRSLAYEVGRRLWAEVTYCLPHISPENQLLSRWVKDPHLDVKDDVQSFVIEIHGRKLRIIIEDCTNEEDRKSTIRKELETLQGRINKMRGNLDDEEGVTEEVRAISFEDAWAQKEAEGYQYGEDALEQVRFGWELAISAGVVDVPVKQIEVEGGVAIAEEMIRREVVEKQLEKEQTLCTTFAKHVVELQGKLETAKLDVAAARRERDEVQLEINRMKQLQCPNCEGLKTVVKQALIECNVYAGTAEIDNIGSILRGGG